MKYMLCFGTLPSSRGRGHGRFISFEYSTFAEMNGSFSFQHKNKPKMVFVCKFCNENETAILLINETKRHIASVDIRQLQYHQVVCDSE